MNRHARQHASLHRQRGVAVVTALLLVALAITIVASLFWQQQVEVRAIENQRLQLQNAWILRGALDWARLILREDGKHSTADYLSEPWATPLAQTRLNQYVEGADDGDGDAGAALLSGAIIDAESRYNLSNLAVDGRVDAGELKTFARLLGILHLDAALAQPIAAAMAASMPVVTTRNGVVVTAPPASTQLPMQEVQDLLATPGVTPAFVDALQPFATVLPQSTPINVNTASPEVLAARLDGLSAAQVQSLVDYRAHAYYASMNDFTLALNALKAGNAAHGPLSVSTQYFLVKGEIRIGRAVLDSWSLIQRNGNGAGTSTRLIWSRTI